MPTHPMRERIYAASTTLEDTCKEEIKGAEGKNLTNWKAPSSEGP